MGVPLAVYCGTKNFISSLILYCCYIMLERPGDLIPVTPQATSIPWTKRRSQILKFLHRGPVKFKTLVYDTNVGDISPLSAYFNPDRISVPDLNNQFANCPKNGEKQAQKNNDFGVTPRLLLYPNRDQEPLFMAKQVNKVERTLSWVMDQDPDPSSSSGASGHSTPEPSTSKNGSMPSMVTEGPIKGNSKPCTLPSSSMSTSLRSVWSDKKESKPWPESRQTGLGLDQLGTRMAQTNDEELWERLERLEVGEKLWGAWDPTKAW